MITKSNPSTYVYARQWSYSKVFSTLTDGPPDANGWYNQIGSTKVTVPGDSITYENSGGRKFNYCDHTKDTVTLSENGGYGPLWTKYSTSGPNQYRLYMGCRFGPARPVAPNSYSVTSEMRKRAWQHLLPNFESGFSLFNFLWELKDFPSLLRDAAHFTNFLRKSGLWDIVKKSGSSKTAAELWLSWSFAIAPLMRDVESMVDLLGNLEKAVNEFIEAGKKPQSFHYRETLGETTALYQTGYWGTKTFNTQRGEYYATLCCRYRYEKPRLFDLFRRRWGLRLTPENLWNAIPFSFIIDWVVDISSALSQFDPDPCLKVEIIDYCDTIKSWSIRKEIRDGGPDWSDRDDFDYLGHTKSGQAGHRGDVVWKWERVHYLRTPGLPDTGYYFPVLDSLSMRELVLGAALLRTN